MKPPTAKELRDLSEAFFAMNDGEHRTDELIRCALNRWADHLDRREQHVSNYLRKKRAKK
jgi:hypothetical protein